MPKLRFAARQTARPRRVPLGQRRRAGVWRRRDASTLRLLVSPQLRRRSAPAGGAPSGSPHRPWSWFVAMGRASSPTDVVTVTVSPEEHLILVTLAGHPWPGSIVDMLGELDRLIADDRSLRVLIDETDLRPSFVGPGDIGRFVAAWKRGADLQWHDSRCSPRTSRCTASTGCSRVWRTRKDGSASFMAARLPWHGWTMSGRRTDRTGREVRGSTRHQSVAGSPLSE